MGFDLYPNASLNDHHTVTSFPLGGMLGQMAAAAGGQGMGMMQPGPAQGMAGMPQPGMPGMVQPQVSPGFPQGAVPAPMPPMAASLPNQAMPPTPPPPVVVNTTAIESFMTALANMHITFVCTTAALGFGLVTGMGCAGRGKTSDEKEKEESSDNSSE